jgi:hypothetical protein
MQDDSLLDDETDSRRLLPLALAGLAVVAVVAVAVVIVGGSGLGFGTDTGGINETELASLQTQEPRCGTHRSSNSSTYIRPADGGVKLSTNTTIPVAARDSELDATLDELGPHRYQLDLERTPGNRSTDCYLELRYNATINLTQRERYTIVVTHDDQFQALFYADPGQSGRYGTSSDPRPPGLTDAEWETALNASDRYFENRTDGGATGGEGGSAAGGSGGAGS